MTIPTKPVMASLGTIILCALIGIANCEIQICTTDRTNDFSCKMVNNGGKLQFEVKRGSQSSTMDIAVANLKRDGSGHLTLNFTIVGATVAETREIEKRDDIEWHLKMSDDAPKFLEPATIIVTHFAGVDQTAFRWPGRSSPSDDREICFHMDKDQSWYNTFEQKIQRWPMDLSAEIGSYPLNSVPVDTNSEIGPIAEYLFVSSKGFAILLDRTAPAFLRIVPSASNTQLCVTSRNAVPYERKNANAAYTDIKFDIFTGANIKDVYDIVSNKLLKIPKPKEIPNDFMIVNPIWSIIAGKGTHFATEVDLMQAKVVPFIETLKKKNYQECMLLLETNWEADSQVLTFNQTRFTNPETMMSTLHSKTKGSYKLSLLVHPYVKADLADKDLSVKDKFGSAALVMMNGDYKDRYIMDFSRKNVRDAFKVKLDKLKEYGVDSFVFDTIAFSSNSFSLSNTKTPAIFVEEYVNLAHEFYGGLSVVRNGYQTQNRHVYTQMSDRASDWGYQKGLKSLIPTALAMSTGGYSFIVPDVVGGRNGKVPSKKLYIRWAQATTFFPTMHFAIPPWDYDLDTENIVKALVDIRLKYKDYIGNVANIRMKDGTPMMRPMWFVAPDEEGAYKVDDQFMLGDDLLVAPVLDEKAEERDVFFPTGDWVDANDNHYTGPGVEQDIKAPLDVLLYFTRVKGSS